MQDTLVQGILQLAGVWVGVEATYFLLKYVGILPRYYIKPLKGKNGNNNGWRILISDAVALGTSQGGVLGQEMVEYDVSGTLTQRIVNQLRRNKQQRIEFLGHAVESFIASTEGYDLSAYETKEASEMSQSYDGLFLGYTEGEIEGQLKLYRRPAKEWYYKHHKRYYKLKYKLNIK